MNDLEKFNEFRRRMNETILGCGHLGLKRFWALDSRAYESSHLDEKTLELLGLATSMVLRCDDCVTYHVIRCIQLGFTDEELRRPERCPRGRRQHNHTAHQEGLRDHWAVQGAAED